MKGESELQNCLGWFRFVFIVATFILLIVMYRWCFLRIPVLARRLWLWLCFEASMGDESADGAIMLCRLVILVT